MITEISISQRQWATIKFLFFPFFITLSTCDFLFRSGLCHEIWQNLSPGIHISHHPMLSHLELQLNCLQKIFKIWIINVKIWKFQIVCVKCNSVWRCIFHTAMMRFPYILTWNLCKIGVFLFEIPFYLVLEFQINKYFHGFTLFFFDRNINPLLCCIGPQHCSCIEILRTMKLEFCWETWCDFCVVPDSWSETAL